jgi:MoxR-like ATPase
MKLKVGPKLETLIECAYRAKRPVLLEGSAGVGKSEIVKAAARKIGIDCTVLNLSIMEAPDLAGMPVIKDGRTTFAPPIILPMEGSGILFLDELNRAPPHVLAPCYQLLTERRLNSYLLPDGWLCVAAMNPSDDARYNVNDMDEALRSRFITVHVEPDVRHWLQWAQQAKVHRSVLEYVSATPKIFDSEKSSPRAWKYVSDFLSANEAEFNAANKGILLVALSGTVGDIHALALLKFMSQTPEDELPAADTIITNYNSVKPKINSWKKGGNTAVLDSLCNSLLIHLQDPQAKNDIQQNKRSQKNIGDFIKDLPGDLKVKMEKHCAWMKNI